MAIDILRENVSIHQTLGDEPNTDNGLPADGLKAQFDRGAEIIRDYINETVVPAVNDAANKSEAAEAAAAEAKSIAESANQKAADALQKAGTAEGAAASAAQIASNASSYANSANDKAQQAMATASDAKQVADTALASAEGSTNRAYEALRIANDVAQEIKAYSPSGTRSIAEAAMRMASERLVAPQSASVGQYFRAKEVDANGVVTAVEAVDAPSGGGGSGENADYVLPVGGEELGGVKNGGNVVISVDGTMTAPETEITGEQISEAVSEWLTDHPEATSTVGLRSVGEDKIKYGTVHGLLLDSKLQGNLPNYDRLKLHTETAYGAYIQGQIAADGTVDTTKTGRVSELFPCYPREVLHLSSQLTTKVAYYTAEMEFISTATMTAGVFEYATPDNAYWYRLQNQYSNGDIALITVRDKELKNRSFKDLILSPIKCRPTICFTGDSNTYGYGLSSVDKSWANLFIAQLSTIGEITYNPFSKWVRCCGAIKYADNANFKTGSYMEFETDAETVTLKINQNYSSAWAWYVDGVTNSANDNTTSLVLDGETHTVRVMFTGGQAVGPKFSITKSVTCINKAVSGSSAPNMAVESGCDWLIVMIGTNHRNEGKNHLGLNFVEYSGKGTYVLPVPTHKIDSGYTLSLFQTIPPLTELFEAFGFEVINCVPELSTVFSDAKYLQGDKIHFSEAGHVIICNTVSAKMGLPTYLTIPE